MWTYALGVTNYTLKDQCVFSWFPLFVTMYFSTSPTLLLGPWAVWSHQVMLTPREVRDQPGPWWAGSCWLAERVPLALAVKPSDEDLFTGEVTPSMLAVLSMAGGEAQVDRPAVLVPREASPSLPNHKATHSTELDQEMPLWPWPPATCASPSCPLSGGFYCHLFRSLNDCSGTWMPEFKFQPPPILAV